MHKKGYQRHQEDQRRRSKMYNGSWYDSEKRRYVRIYRYRRSKSVKTASNRKLRRNRDSNRYNGGSYRRLYEYWWEMY